MQSSSDPRGICQGYFFHDSSYNKNSLEIDKTKNREVIATKRILNVNDTIAKGMRAKFRDKKVFVLNMMSSPGSGKTTLLRKTLQIVMQDIECAIIVGDICTTNDADRLSGTGAEVIQINTDKFGGDCHLTASSVGRAMESIDLDKIDVLIVENIGNLVCPAEFDIGENKKIVVLSVTEGEDKPEKYPLMFRESDVVLLNKIDLLPYLDFDIELTKRIIKRINPNISIFEVSAKTGSGFDLWTNWLKNQVVLKPKVDKFGGKLD